METKIKKNRINFYELPMRKYHFKVIIEELFDGYNSDEKVTSCVLIDIMHFTDKRFNILGSIKKLSSNGN